MLWNNVVVRLVDSLETVNLNSRSLRYVESARRILISGYWCCFKPKSVGCPGDKHGTGQTLSHISGTIGLTPTSPAGTGQRQSSMDMSSMASPPAPAWAAAIIGKALCA